MELGIKLLARQMRQTASCWMDRRCSTLSCAGLMQVKVRHAQVEISVVTWAWTVPASVAPPRAFISWQAPCETLLTASPPAAELKVCKASWHGALLEGTGGLQWPSPVCWGLSFHPGKLCIISTKGKGSRNDHDFPSVSYWYLRWIFKIREFGTGRNLVHFLYEFRM